MDPWGKEVAPGARGGRVKRRLAGDRGDAGHAAGEFAEDHTRVRKLCQVQVDAPQAGNQIGSLIETFACCIGHALAESSIRCRADACLCCRLSVVLGREASQGGGLGDNPSAGAAAQEIAAAVVFIKAPKAIGHLS